MMRSLAEFVMRGQLQAALVAFAATMALFLNWFGAAVVALVILRHGKGALPVAAAAAAAATWYGVNGNIGPLVTLVAVCCAAMVLRATRQWRALLLALSAIAAGLALAVMGLAGSYVDQSVEIFVQSLDQVQAQAEQAVAAGQAQPAVLERIEWLRQQPPASLLMAMFAVLQMLTALLSMMLARWWQAMLYNPGGLQSELHALRLGRLDAVVLVAVLLFFDFSAGHQLWSMLAVVPLVVAALALLHALVRHFALGTFWLVVTYLSILAFMPLVVPLLMMLAIVDSAVDIRARLAPRNPPGDS